MVQCVEFLFPVGTLRRPRGSMLIQQTQEQRNVEYQVTCQCYLLHSAAVGLFELAYFPLVSSESQDSHLRLERKKERKGKERKGKERKGKERKD